MNSTLRPDQEHALELLRQSLRAGNKRPMMQAPTGFGKTMLAAAICDGILKRGKQAIMTVPAITLVDQTVDKFAKEGITDVGVIQATHTLTNSFAPIQVASIDTLCRRPLPKADYVLIDEAHRLHKFYGEWMTQDEWRKIPFIGLSATPWTKGLGRLYDDLLIPTSTQKLIDAGHLSQFRVFAPAHPDLSGVRTIAGDYHEGELSSAMQKGAITAGIVSTWKEKAENRPTMVFAVDRAHARQIQNQFQADGIMTAYIDAFTPRVDRNRLGRQFGRDFQVIVNVGCLILGVDWDVRCIVLARPTKSEMLFTQIIGRGLRTAAGKADCLILDHSDTHQRLGFVTDIHHDHLDDGKTPINASKAEVPLPKECPQCHYLRAPRKPTCPNCGFTPVVVPRIKTVDGELTEVDGKKHKATMIEKQDWYSGLLGYAREKGYKDGWAANQYREKFGVWPNHMQRRVKTPTIEMRSWIKSQAIRYAKRKEKELAAAQKLAAEIGGEQNAA
jgi:DNA repair protein RadD